MSQRETERPGTPNPPQASPGSGEEQARSRSRAAVTIADLLTLSRIPLAVAFVAVESRLVLLVILGVAAATDLLDGIIARRIGGSRFGAFIDPVADKLFMLAAFVVVALSGRLAWYELAGALIRDIAASVAFVVTLLSGRAMTIPARLGGKAVTFAQVMTVAAFLLDSPFLRPFCWATAGIGMYAIWDYVHAAPRAKRAVGS
ncbi:MAG: CDP-alcohol phosphatidyltransferase family protein [Gemmatimonadota bacterium]|nr:CDP-alcohol phosphatidyltransferase family protein [Gemmatimonadota bacterium]MDH5282298.1 CDP-alcohol phosphatidyltransferase family protein [Gemmatimonadota bacterium]